MNPAVIALLVILLYQENNSFPNYFDTFRLGRLVEQLELAVDNLDHINKLTNIAREPIGSNGIIQTIGDSIHSVHPLLPEGKSKGQLEKAVFLMDGVRNLGGLSNLIKNAGPMMNMLSALSASNNSSLDPYESIGEE